MTRAGCESVVDSIFAPPMQLHSGVVRHSGNHRMNGILLMKGPALRRGVKIEGAEIIDLAPTILHLLGLPIPSYMDGKVLKEALDERFLQSSSPRVVKSQILPFRGGKSLKEVLTERETELDRLRVVLRSKEEEIVALQDLVTRFQRGRFIRTMAALHRLIHRFRSPNGG